MTFKLETSPNLAQRADIQSLRALAVGLVVAAHAKFPWLPGGYVGVDVFFVLSGYLISGLILREVQRTGRFDPWLFYARRQKRLLPALLLVILCTAGAAWSLLSPLQQVADVGAAQAAMLWLSNFYFATRAIDYFSSGPHGNLFLHTWSLSVEEQFYLVWPWLLLFFFGVWRWQGKPMSLKRLVAGLALVTAASLAVAIYCARHSVNDGFYLMPSRAWEFSLGGLTYLLRTACETGRFRRVESLRGRSILDSAGWICILAAAAFFSENLRYPGAWAILPCAGAALTLLDAPEKRPQAVVSRLTLRQPALLFVGDISYSLYLWHWPVLSIGIQLFGSDPLSRLGLVILCLLLAAVTYVTVERPIHQAPLRNKAKVLILSVAAIAAGFLAMSLWEREAIELLNSPEQAEISAARFDIPDIYAQGCDTWYHSAEVSPCIQGPASASRTVVMFGDSALAQWQPAVAEIFLRMRGWRIVVLTKSACPPSQVSYYYERIKADFEVCDRWRQRAIEHIVKLRPDMVIMGSRSYAFTPAQWTAGTHAVLAQVAPAAGSVAILSPTPDLGFDGPNCLSMEINVPNWMPRRSRCETKPNPPPRPSILEILQNAASHYSNVEVIDLSNFVCPDGICRARISGDIVFRDSQHLTASFVQSLAPAFEHALNSAGLSH